jgi:hypothetical protein
MTSLAIKPAIFAALLTLTGLRGSAVFAAPARRMTGHWEVVTGKQGRGWRFRIDIPSSGEQRATVDFVDIAGYGVEFTATLTKDTVRLERKSAAGTTAVEGRLEGSRMTGRLLFSGIDAPFTGVRTDASPPVVSDEAVSFANGGVTLAGTILSPAGEGPFPAIVCTHGSGPGDRQFAAYRSEGVFYARLGLALAYLNRKEEAVREGESAASLVPVTKDAYEGAYIQHQLVRIYILVGEPEKALDHLEPLLKIPYYLSPGWLKIDPNFDPLQKNPRFQKLIAGAK